MQRKLTVRSGPAAGSELEIDREIVIGRENADLTIADEELSRRHVALRPVENGVEVEDLGSLNGTEVDGRKLDGPTTITIRGTVKVGHNEIAVDVALPQSEAPIAGGDQPTRARDIPATDATVARPIAPGAQPTAARATPPPADPVPPVPPAGPPPAAPQAGGPPPGGKAKKESPRLPLAASIGIFAAVMIALVAIVLVVTNGDDDDEPATASSESVPADTAGWVYTISNRGGENANSVVAVDYAKNGGVAPARIREFSTEGSGAGLIPGESLGALAGDGQITISPDKKFLFAVNQGSDTIAVFKIDRATGSLEHVEGSPFPSGGRAPTSTDFNGKTLVVVNHGIVPGEKVPGDPQKTNYASFSVSATGALKPVNVVPAPGSGPTAALFDPAGKVVFGTGFYSSTLDSLTVAGDGKLGQAPGSPQQFPASVTKGAQGPPGSDPNTLKLAYGVGVHPSKPFAYFIAAVANKVATYRYDPVTGRLTFASQVDNPDTIAACWIDITEDGRFLYTGNSSLSVTAYGISEDGAKLKRIELQRGITKSTIANVELDASDKFLFTVATSDSPDNPLGERASPANYIEAYTVADDGSLEPNGSVTLPVPRDTLPYGIAVLQRDG